MLIQKGNMDNKIVIINIIKEAITDMESKNIYQWDNIYPDEDVINDDIINGNAFVCIDEGVIKGYIALNEHQEEEYKAIEWKYSHGRQLVIHRLCIKPKFQGCGIARLMVKFAEDYARSNGYESIRLDAFINNEHALRLYENSGYRKAGIVNYRKGDFYCYEKSLT